LGIDDQFVLSGVHVV